MSLFQNVSGVMGADFIVGGPSGIMLRKVAGGFEVRDNTGTNLQALTASTIKTNTVIGATSPTGTITVGTTGAGSIPAVVIGLGLVDGVDVSALDLQVKIIDGTVDTSGSFLHADAQVLLGADAAAAARDVTVLSNADAAAAARDVTVLSGADAAAAARDVTVLSNAKAYADGLAVHYDPVGSASTAESNAKAYASTAESNAKAYTDLVASGLNLHEAVRLATVAALPAVTASGTRETHKLTANAFGVLSIDNKTVALSDRVLVKNQVNAMNNGIYILTTVGGENTYFVLTRAVDFDGTPPSEVKDGSFFFVQDGDTMSGEGFVQIQNSPVIESTDILFTQFSSAGNITAGNGLTKSGNTINLDINDITTTITEIADGDMIAIADASDSNLTKKITKANLVAGIVSQYGGSKHILLSVGTSSVSSIAVIPAGAIVKSVTTDITTPYTSGTTATIQVIVNGTVATEIQTTAENLPSVVNTYSSNQFTSVSAGNGGVARVVVTAATGGASKVMIEYVEAPLA